MESLGRSIETAELDYRGQRRELVSTKACLIHVADPPSSAISYENPPRRMCSSSRERRQLQSVDLHINNANAYEESLAVLIQVGGLASMS